MQGYVYWREFAVNQTKEGQPPEGTAFAATGPLGTYANASMWSGALEEVTTQLNLTDMSNVVFKRKVLPGPLLDRRVLASALVVDPVDPDKTFTLIREYVQPYNFSNDGTRLTFLTPTYPQIAEQLNGPDRKYATITISVRGSGTALNVTQLLYVTEDCPAFGMVGRGLNCRKCPQVCLRLPLRLRLHCVCMRMYACAGGLLPGRRPPVGPAGLV